MRLLLVFLQEPTPGRVKSQLTSEIGDEEACRYHHALIETLLKQLQGLMHTQIRFCYTPDDAGEAIRFWLLPKMKASTGPNDQIFMVPTTPSETEPNQAVDFFAQGDGSPSARINRAFQQGFEDGFQEIAAIGTDCPECGARWINAAFARLASAPNRDAVLGSHPEGQVYLLAMNSHLTALFDNTQWNSPETTAEILSTAKQLNLTVDALPHLPAIHTLNDWNKLMLGPLAASIKKSLGETANP